MHQNNMTLLNPTTARYYGSGFRQNSGKPSFSSHSLRTPSPCFAPRINSVSQSSNPYAPLYGQALFSSGINNPDSSATLTYPTSSFFSPASSPAVSFPTYYPANPQASTCPSVPPYAPVHPYALPYPYASPYPYAPSSPCSPLVNTQRNGSNFGLEVILIAILLLTALDLTLVRPYKYGHHE